MGKETVLERLLASYRSSFDIERPYAVSGETYDAYGAFRVTSSKYVLTKKVELWRAQCYEHVFFKLTEEVTQDLLDRFLKQIREYIEPQMVRHNEPCPPKDHMYTFITGIYICENGISPEMKKQIRRFRFSKNYRFTIRGYCDARLVVIDVKNQKIYGNPAARDIVNGYRKMKNLFI